MTTPSTLEKQVLQNQCSLRIALLSLLSLFVCNDLLLADEAATSPSRRGALAPEVHVQSWSDGKEYSIEKLRGRVVLLNFTSTRCGPCQLAGPILIDIKKHYKDFPLDVLSIFDSGDDPKDVDVYVAEHQGTVAGIDCSSTDSDVGKTFAGYGNHGTPNFVLIGPQGKIEFNSLLQQESPEVKNIMKKHGLLDKDPPSTGAEEEAIVEAIKRVWEEMLRTEIDRLVDRQK